VLRVRRVDFFARVGAFEMKILCVREIYEERKRRGKKTKQNQPKKARQMRKKGDSGCVIMIFFWCVRRITT
jgi:hypothetical protein